MVYPLPMGLGDYRDTLSPSRTLILSSSLLLISGTIISGFRVPPQQSKEDTVTNYRLPSKTKFFQRKTWKPVLKLSVLSFSLSLLIVLQQKCINHHSKMSTLLPLPTSSNPPCGSKSLHECVETERTSYAYFITQL